MLLGLAALLGGPSGSSRGADTAAIAETDLHVGTCTGRPGTCLRLDWPGGAGREFLLSSNPKASGIQTGLIGNHFGGPLPAAFVYWLTGENPAGSSGAPVALSIFDLNGKGMVATVAPPPAEAAGDFEGYSLNDTYFAVLQGPAGRQYPLLAPGNRYLNRPHWNFLCVFDPDRIAHPEPGCGRGFRKASADFPDAVRLAGFRHQGGWLEDVDGDGWQDINLPFLRYILVVSGRTGRSLALLHPDIARRAQPDSVPDFDAGRHYGTFTPFIDADGRHDVLIVAGAPPGFFNYVNCNVSRYVAVLTTPVPELPASRVVKWADFISFTKDVFRHDRPPTPETITRAGDNINKCVHRVSDGLFTAGDRQLTLYNLFTTDPPLDPDTCRDEEIAERIARFAADKMQAWTDCARKAFAAATGGWQVVVRDLADGRKLGAFANSYVWGRVRNLVPGVPEAFILETTPAGLRFDRAGYAASRFEAVALEPDFNWRHLGALPAAVPPRFRDTGRNTIPYRGAVGSTEGQLTEMVTRPGPEGLTEFQLRDNRWIGYAPASGEFVVREAPAAR